MPRLRLSVMLAGATILAGCGGTVDEALDSAPPPSATSYVVIDPPTTTVAVTEPPEASAPSGAGTTSTTVPGEYVVRANDSVYRVAERFGLTPEELAEINGWSDGINHTILPGDTSLVAPPTTDSVPATGSLPGKCPTTYTIQSGDTTPIGVAERFGITFEAMDAANADTPGYSSFVVGTEITIPCPS